MKRIEAIGFKSFATKTVINFDKGLTAIVGPNGSGKSNVSDSIRFVLGEQSVKSLRGGKMEDVIFAGTDHKKALNMAEVTIVLDNEARELPLDYGEVSITRRVFRAGGGEYLINGEKARLKDVTDLIMDSGIGHDSLSMISQDQVKQVIEGKPEDRRLILEESAGILKYKTRKKEALRKLGTTHENLQRVSDIIGELENQIEPLRIQAKEAKSYLEVKEKLSDLEVRLLAHDIRIDNEKLGQLKDENEALTVQMLSLTKKTEADELRHEQLTEEHHGLTNEIQDLQFDLTNHAEELQKKRGEAQLLNERMNHAALNVAELEGRKKSLLASLENLNSEKVTAETLAKEAMNKFYEKKQTDQEAYHTEHIVPLEKVLEKAKAAGETVLAKQKTLEEALFTNKDDSQKLMYQLETAKNQLGFLLDAKEDFVGFSEGTKQVLRGKKSGKLQGIEGAVAELVTVPAAYEVAMDVILGPIANQIVTVNDTHAKSAINYLRENRFGRATFLPMSVMKSRRLAPDILQIAKNMAGFVSLASDALIYDEKYGAIIENLVGNVVIAQDLEVATQMAKRTNHRFRIVTLEGDVINPGGAMTGGALNRKNSSSVLKQNQQIEAQKGRIGRLEEALLALEVTKQDIELKMSDIDAQVAKKQGDIVEAQLKLEEARENNLRTSYELKVELVSLEANLESGLSDVRRIEQAIEELHKQVVTVEGALGESDENQVEFQQQLAVIEEEIAGADQVKADTTEKIRENRSKLVTLTETLKHLELETREARRTTNEVNGMLNKLSGEIGKLDMKIDVAIEKLEQEYEMTFDYAVQHYPLRADVAGARSEVLSLNRQLSRFGAVNIGAIDEYERVRERYEFLEAESADLNIAADNLQASIDEMDGEMVVKFKETFDLVRHHYIETFTELFGGGEADLILSDPEDLLNTGVEIIARPPGTKLGTSTLLSGGQKALTSIAMLFAILKIRTIPFCILDEVEAALDEANVARYAKYLKIFSDQTQFIVITHRRGTMEEAHVLYGVTMQERGVTTMVSVKMDGIDAYVDG